LTELPGRDMWSSLEGRAFDSVRPWALRIAALESWPSVTELDALLSDRLSWPDSVALEPQRAKKKRRRAPVARDALYEARIHLAKRIPTRERSWHDLANALVWAAFPRAKRALAARQYAALAARVPELADRLPATRTREQDTLAMLDEGGLVLLVATDADGTEAREACSRRDARTVGALQREGRLLPLVFGHALLEHAASGRAMDVRAFGVILSLGGPDLRADRDATRDLADRALAAKLLASSALDSCSVSLAAVMGA
jgi:hypothetical protein